MASDDDELALQPFNGGANLETNCDSSGVVPGGEKRNIVLVRHSDGSMRHSVHHHGVSISGPLESFDQIIISLIMNIQLSFML